jgi:hypothetical protein
MPVSAVISIVSPAIEYHCLISSIAAAPGSMSPLISAAAFGGEFFQLDISTGDVLFTA